MDVWLLLVVLASACVALCVHGPTRSGWLRVAVCALSLPLTAAAQWLLDRYISDPAFRESLAADVFWIWAMCLPAFALGAGWPLWKWIVRIQALTFIVEVGCWMPVLLSHIPEQWRTPISLVTNVVLMLMIAGLVLQFVLAHFEPARSLLRRAMPSIESSLQHLAWPLAICLAGFVILLFREPLLALWPHSPLRHEAWMLALGSLFAVAATYLGVKALDEFGGHPLPRSFRIAAPVAAVALYWLLSVSPDGRCLPFLVLMALLPAWGRWHVSTLWGALLGMLLIALVHASLTNVATFGPRLFLYLSITCFCYGYFFVPRAVDANRPA